jgi:hypothetical protein
MQFLLLTRSLLFAKSSNSGFKFLLGEVLNIAEGKVFSVIKVLMLVKRLEQAIDFCQKSSGDTGCDRNTQRKS